MKSELCSMLGVDFPLLAFSHCRDVVAAVSRAGGFGVFGGARYTPQELEIELKWIDEHVDGKPYGVDIQAPEHSWFEGKERGLTLEQVVEAIPTRHRDFIASVLKKYDVEMDPAKAVEDRVPFAAPEVGEALMDVAFSHPIRLIANALGIAPPSMLSRGRAHGVPVAALVGAKEHALRQIAAGVDILVAQGTEAGGHCGEVSTLVLVPEVIRAIKPIRSVPVLAAGGIMTGRQMAGCMAMGAAGVWCGSVWLSTVESETSEVFRSKMIEASSRSTVRSTFRTGKPCRQLRSVWHDEWEAQGSPGPLPHPLMGMISMPAFGFIEKSAQAGNPKAKELVSYFVGQGVGLVDCVRTTGQVVQDFKQEFADALEDMMAWTHA